MRRFQVGCRASVTWVSAREWTRDRVLARAITTQIPAGYQRRQDHIGFVNREAAEPRNLGGRQA